MIFKLNLNIILFSWLITFAFGRRECLSRDYGNNGTVCVCNITYCDNLIPIQRTQTGIVTMYESSRSGLRFKETKSNFSHNFENFTVQLKQTIKINTNRRYQRIIGFGGSFTDATGINIKSLATHLQINLLSDYFSPVGIQYTLCRVPMAGTDFSTRPYTYDDVANDTDLSKFSLQSEDFNYKIPYIQLARTLSSNQLKLFGCPWSAPYWLKTTGSINGGTIIGELGNAYYEIWANYFVKFLNAYERHGISFWGITVQNEPSFGFIPSFNSANTLGFTPQMVKDFVKLKLGPTLLENGYGVNKLKLMIGDDQRPNDSLYNLPSVYDWAEAVLGDKTAKKYVSGIGFHWYLNTPNNTYFLDQTYHRYPNHFILSTEACNGVFDITKVLLGSWQRAEAYAIDIIEDLNHYTSGWVDWNMALDLKGGPNWVNNFVDAPIIVNASAQEYYKQPTFYALGHFSKFLPPNSTRIELSTDINIDNFMTTAFIRPDNGIVVIAVNSNDESVLLTIKNSNNAKVVKEVQPHSIQSYIWWN